MSTSTRRGFLGKAFFLMGAPLVGAWANGNRRELSVLLAELGSHLPDFTPPARMVEEITRIEEDSRIRGRKTEINPFFENGPEKDYATYLGGLGLSHIRPHEVVFPHYRTREGVANCLPPKSLWRNMAPTLKVADELRARLGVPLRMIASAYRCPAYNAKCPGAAQNSMHLQNRALDLIFDCSPQKAFNTAMQLRNEGRFEGGLGLYPGFIHIDTRGWNSTWGNA